MTNLALHLSSRTLTAIKGRRLTQEGLRYIAMNIFISRVLDFVEDGVIRGRIDRRYPETLCEESVDLLFDCLEAAKETIVAMSDVAFASEESRHELLSDARGYMGDNGELATSNIMETCVGEAVAEYCKTQLYCVVEEAADVNAQAIKPELGFMQAAYLQRFGIALFDILSTKVAVCSLPDGSLDSDGIVMTLACTDAAIGMLGELNEYGVYDEKSRRAVHALMRVHLDTERLETGGPIAERVMASVVRSAS